MIRKRLRARETKRKYRRGLNFNISKEKKVYVIDTSVIINKLLRKLIKKGIKGKIIIPNAVMSELENLANKGKEEGFIGLEEIAKMHKIKDIKIYFYGARPNEMQIRFAKSGEIDALIRDIAIKNKAILVTSDLVLAKSSKAYGLDVIYAKPKIAEKKRKFWPIKKVLISAFKYNLKK